MAFGLFDCDHIHVLFWLSYELLTWKCIDESMAKVMKKMFEELLTMF